MTARAPVYIDSGKLHVFEDGDTLPPWLSPSSMAWENLTGVPAGITQLADLTGPGYAKIDAAGAWSVQAAIPQADVSGLTTALAGLQPISARLTAIAGLTDTAGWLHDDGSGAWSISVPTKSDVGLSLVENTALSTWGGSANLATLGTVTTGVWHGTAIADAYISSAATWNAKEGGLGNPSTSGYLLSSTSAGVRSWVAPYSLPTATASVLGGVKVGTGLAIASSVLSVAYGTTAGTACVGNDSRLSDSRTPTAHALDGALHTISGKTAGQVLVATGATTFGFATISGDAALSGAGALTLATLLTAGSAGSATTVPTLTWDAKGRLTAVGSAAISISHSQINDWAASVSSVYLPLAGGTMTGSLLGGASTDIGSTTAWLRNGFFTALYVGNAAVLTANQAITLTGAVTGSGTTSIATTFANPHLAGINQDLTTTSLPMFNYLTLTNRLQINSSQWGAGISQDGLQCDVIGYYSAWDANKLFINTYNNGVGYGAARFSGVYLHGILTTPEGISTTTLTASGLITANGGISGNLTGHASLDIPLTGSSAITGALIPNGSTYTLGNPSNRWQVFGNIVSASAGFEGNLAGNVTGNVTGSASLNLLLAGGDLSGHLGLKSTQVTGSSSYAVSHSDCGTIIFQNDTYGVNVTLGTNNNFGDWIISCSNGGINISGVSAKYKGVTYTNSALLASATANSGVLMCLWDGTYWWIG